MSKAKRTLKRIFCIILLVIFSPFLFVYWIVKSITNKARKKMWKSNGLSGSKLVLLTDIDYLEKMSNFEADDYFKYLFFYDGYDVKMLINKKNKPQMILTRNNENFLLKYQLNQTKSTRTEVERLKQEKKTKKIDKAIYITTKHVDGSIKAEYFSQNIKILDRDEFINFYSRVQKNIKNNISSTQLSDKTMTEQLHEMYPNHI